MQLKQFGLRETNMNLSIFFQDDSSLLLLIENAFLANSCKALRPQLAPVPSAVLEVAKFGSFSRIFNAISVHKNLRSLMQKFVRKS
jgi:hypothetical protein